MSDKKHFPVLMAPCHWEQWRTCPKSIPWNLLSEQRALTNHGLTLEQLAERGGLSPIELMANINDNPLRPYHEPEIAMGRAVCLLFAELERSR